jgi:hypothetical protein
LGIKDEIMEASFPKIGLLFATAINQRQSRRFSLKSNNLTIKNPKSKI